MKIELIDEEQAYNSYDEALDEQGEIKIGSLTYCPSNVLKNVDEIAYRCGFNDYVDSLMQDGTCVTDQYIEGQDFFICKECEQAYDEAEEKKECCEVENETKPNV